MWWLLNFYDFIWPLLSLTQAVGAISLDRVLTRFIMLGIIPGVNYQISFGDIICALWLGLSIYVVYSLFFKAQKIINKVDPYRRLPANVAYINLIAL